MSITSKRRQFLPAMSLSLVYGNFLLLFFVFTELKLSFATYFLSNILIILVLPISFLFLESLDPKKRSFDLWKSFPPHIHQIICIIGFLAIVHLMKVAIIPILKKNYEEK